ncbi:hypothetical protein HD597_003032 [Nonomuraea thailandensis]|uniref:Uncharacterized protein n=1 Tax=Nonomuraea thailandensis TaxID=1188745 RepID=A0A9X2GBN5_9ACTN|nr:hypothetical protein [Nonomuraea thailandensis]MCP2356012.1 hypothetical protein [Nonomuraea thailandensis]
MEEMAAGATCHAVLVRERVFAARAPAAQPRWRKAGRIAGPILLAPVAAAACAWPESAVARAATGL